MTTDADDLPARLEKWSGRIVGGEWLHDAAARIRELEARNLMYLSRAEDAEAEVTRLKGLLLERARKQFSLRKVEPDYKWAGRQQS